MKWSPVENFKDLEEDVKSQFSENIHINNNLKDDYLFSCYANYNRHFQPESIDMKLQDNRFLFSFNKDLIKEEEIKDNIKNNIDYDLVNIDLENSPFDKFNNNINNEDYIIAVTGHTFETLWKLRNKYIENKNKDLYCYYETFRKILQNGFIFARMSPEHKTILVECLREEKFTVLMCGDGANDCGALRAADVGVSLSIEEASIAAHFTSKKPDISCLIKLINEGKASLVTSIQTFKYMMIYSLIQFICVTLLLILNSYLSDNQFLASDVFIIFPLAFLIARTGASEELTAHQPNGALISIPIVTSILIQTLIQFTAQYGIYVILAVQDGFENNCTTDNIVEPCEANSVSIFLIFENFSFLKFVIYL